jgi:DNA-binding response OmpR family regulator
MIEQLQTLHGADILIVDDTPENLDLLFYLLTAYGYQVRAAPDGVLALHAARSATPDLVLLDIVMPDLDGYAVCAQLKADPRTADVPILFLSAASDTRDKVKAFESGGVDYITKPFEPSEVLARVQAHVALHRLQRQLAAQNAQLRQEIAERQRAEAEREPLIAQLQEALANIRTLRGLVPICAACKKIRDDTGYWNQLESYLHTHTEGEFSHGICPTCARQLYPELYDEPADA